MYIFAKLTINYLLTKFNRIMAKQVKVTPPTPAPSIKDNKVKQADKAKQVKTNAGQVGNQQAGSK